MAELKSITVRERRQVYIYRALGRLCHNKAFYPSRRHVKAMTYLIDTQPCDTYVCLSSIIEALQDLYPNGRE